MASLFGALDERIMLAAQPVVSITGGDVLLGEQTTVTVTFDNEPDGSSGGNVGFAPYIDLILPQNGADGAGVGNSPVNDGITFLGAQTLGIPITSTVIEFDADGEAIHPFARDGLGNLRVVKASDYGATAGDSLVVLRLPFGSFVPEQTPISISVNLQLSPLADLGTPLTLSAVGGFAFGRDALNNPVDDHPVLGTVATNSIVPTLLKVSKIVDAPEAETATGPNFPRNWIGTLDIPAGQTLTNVTFTDRLPDGIVINGPIQLAGAVGTAVYDPTTHSVIATIPTVTGVAGADVTLTIPFYVNEFMRPGFPTTPVLDPSLGDSRLLENHLSATATWTPADPRDDDVTITVDPAGPEAVLTAKSIAIQKSQTVVTSNGGGGSLGPGAVLEYLLNGQVSDYFAQQNLVVTDSMGDGQAFLASFVPVLTVTEGGLTNTGDIAGANYDVVRDPDTGITTIIFRLSDELRTRGGDAALTGGAPGAPATFSIAFRALVETTFLANGDAVGQGDKIGNSVAVGAAVVGGLGTPGDTSAAAGVIAVGSVAKSLYAVNGAILPEGAGVGSPIQIASGDLITFRLKYTLPQGIVSTLILTDFLPLPVFDVDSFTLVVEDTVSADPPPENILRWGPDAVAFDAAVPALPVVSSVSAENKLVITFIGPPAGSPPNLTADVLFTVRVIDKPFGDGLMLTNQVTGTEINANSTISATSNALAQVTLTEPTLRLTKGVIATNQPVGVLSPTPVGPVSFTSPGTPGVRFADEINSIGLAARPVNSDLSNIDGSDLVSFAIVVENIGTGKNGAFDIRVTDTLPPGFAIPPGGLNLQVTDGARTHIPFVGDLFGPLGITLVDGAGSGALEPFTAVGGANILVITYDLITSDQVQPRTSIENIATIKHYASFEGGVNRVPNTQVPTSDNALIRVADPTFEKSVFSTNVGQTGKGRGDPTLEDLTIGEQVTFDLVATLRDGLIRGFEITDTLPAGRIEFVSATMQFAGADLFAGNGAGGTAGALAAPTIIRDGNIVRFVFAEEIVNLATNQTAESDVIRLRLTGVVTDAAGNTPGTVLTNNAALQFDLGAQEVFIQDDAKVEVVGPDLAITKTPDRTVADAGDIVTYTVVATARDVDFTGPAFDVLLRDALPSGLSLVAGSATLLSAPAGTPPPTEVGNEVRLSIPELKPGETIRFTYQARLADTVGAGTVLTNTVALKADSFPGTPPLLPGGIPGPERSFDLGANAEVRVATVAIAKTVAAADTSLDETTSNRFNPSLVDLAIGEIVTYRIVITLPEVTTSRLTVTDFLPGALSGPGRLQFLSGDVTQVGSNLTFLDLTGPAVDVAAVGSATAAGGILDTATFTFGRVENRPDGNPNPTDADRIFITVTARVLDVAANSAGVAPVNNAQVDFGTGINQASATVEIVEPSVGIVKTSSRTSGDGGDSVTFNVRIPTTSANGGPAYDVVVQDEIPVGFEIDTATLAFTTPTRPDWTLSYDSATRTITARLPVYLVEDVDPIFQYTVAVANEVRPDQVLTSRASVTFDSHPGDPGDQFQRDYGPVRASTNFTVDRPELNKTVFTSDLATTPLNEAAIGETMTYRIELRLPEVQSTFELRDLLPSLTGVPPSEGSMELISSRIVSIGSNLTFTPSGPAEGDAGAVITGGVAWNLGQIRNTADNIRDGKDVIVFEVVARVPNIPANQPGDDLINLARVDYGLASGGTAFVSDTETITIVGPELVATKTPSAATGDAGDVITYTISIAPDALASTADAYGVVVTDALHPLLRLDAGSVTATLGGLDIGTIVTGNKAGDSTIRFTLDRLPDATAVPLLITYRATLLDTVRAGNTIPNTVDIAWRSAPDNGDFPQARGDATSASASVGVAINDSFTKNVIATTLDETTGDDVALGERVTYELVATLGEGTQSLLIQDAFPVPPGMAIVSASVFSIGAGISGSLLKVGDAGLITGNSVRFDFGNNVVNDGTNGAGSEQIVMRVVGRVVADPAVNPDGRILTNAATLTSDTASTPLTASDSVRVVAPNVLIDKSGNVTAGHAGDIVTYTVVVRQQAGATGPLYDLVVTDPLPARMALVEGSVTTDRGTVILGDDAGETSVEVRLAGAALLAADNPATPGVDESRVIVTYRARILDSAEPGETITNRADFTGSTAPASIVTDPTERRSVSGSDNAVVAVNMPIDLAKTIFDTALPDTGPGVAVGETVTYRLTATVTPGTQTLVISDTLPPGMTFESARVVSVAGGLPLAMLAVLPTTPAVGSTGAVTFDFGTIVNPGADTAVDSVTVEIVTRVADVPGNGNGTNLLNAASATVASPTNPGAPGGTLTDTANVSVLVVAPVLVIDKSAPPAFLAPGETVVYTLELRHAGTSTSPAYDVVVNDPLADPYLELVPGTVTALVNGVAAGTIVTAGGTLRVELPILRLGEVLTIAFTGRALATMPVAETLTNTVTASYDSANDGVPGTEGRPGSTTDTQNLPGQPGLDKEIVATSFPETGVSFFDPARVDLAIGAVVTYRLTITLPQGLTKNLILTDTMPGGLQPLAGRVVGVGAGFPPGLLGVAATIDPATGRVAFNFGDVTNTSLAAVGAEDRIVVEIDARVRDAGGPAAGDTLTNMAKADFTIGGRAGTLTDVVTVDVVEPSLTIDKAVIGAKTGDAGDIITYTVTIAHASASSGPAYDLVVTDPLPASLVPLSVTSSRGSASFVPGGVQLSLGTAAFLPTEGPITLTYTARLADTVEPGQVIPNTATLNFDSAKGDGGRAGTASDTAEVKAVFTADLQKTVTGTSLPKTGSSSFNPDRPDVAIGETVFYQLQATISEGTQRLVITDNVPEGMRILSGNLVTRGSGITGAAPVITISADERSITFDFGTVVNAGSTSPLDASDRITLAVSTLVIDGPLQIAGRELTNNAQVVISSPTEPGRPGGTVTDDASATVDLVTSVLALDKSASPPVVDAGDEVTYTLTLRHPGESTGPAYNVLVSDVLSAAVTYIPGSLRVVSGPGAATFVGTDRIEVLAEVLLLTDVVTIEYRARVTDAIEPGQVIPNTANVAFASAPNVEGRPGNDDASASVLGQFQVALDKQIIATSLPQTGNGFFDPAAADLAIGETATYRLTVTLSEGTQRLVLTDSLPAGMVIESASVAGLGAGISAFSLTSLTFSGTSFRLEALVVNTGNNLLGDGTILVDVVARVADVAANVAGRPLVNMAEATVSSPTSPGAPGGTLSATDTAPADVATPVLVFDKAVGEPFAGLGEPVTYTLTLTHAGNSTAPAFNVVLQDLIADQNLALVPGSVVTSLGVVVLGNGGADGVVRVELAELAIGQTLTVTFRAVATDVPTPDGIAPNTASFAVASSPDAPAGFKRPFLGSDTASLQVSSGLDFVIGARAGGSLFGNDIDPENAPFRVPQAPPIFTGTATPGAVVQLAIRDQNGRPLAVTSSSADASGAWLIRGPDPIGPQGDLPTADDFVPSRGGLSLARADSVPQTAGLNNAPFSVVAQGTNPVIGTGAPAADGIRLSYAGTGGIANGVFIGGSDQVSTASAGTTGTAVARDLAGLTAPQSLAWNRFALDFVAATASPSAAR